MFSFLMNMALENSMLLFWAPQGSDVVHEDSCYVDVSIKELIQPGF